MAADTQTVIFCLREMLKYTTMEDDQRIETLMYKGDV